MKIDLKEGYYNDVDGKVLAISFLEHHIMFKIYRGNCLEAVALIKKRDLK